MLRPLQLAEDTMIQLFIIISLAVASASLTLSRAAVFSPLRRAIVRRSHWWGELATCPYCTSHYVALVAALVWHPLGSEWRFILLATFALVTLAAWWMGLIFIAIEHLGPSGDMEEHDDHTR